MNELKVTKEKVLEAAKVSKEGKEVLEKLFPEVFEEEYYDFGEEFNTNTFCISPFFIARSFAKNKNDEYKVLIVDPEYSAEIIPKYYGNRDGIKLKRKTNKQ